MGKGGSCGETAEASGPSVLLGFLGERFKLALQGEAQEEGMLLGAWWTHTRNHTLAAHL